MRKSTPYHVSHAWYLKAMAGENPPITHEPQCGWFKRKMIKGGPWVPVTIYIIGERDEETGELLGPEVMKCLVNGREADPDDQWTYVADKPITITEYDYLFDLGAWAKKNDDREPLANPTKKINHLDTPVPVFKSRKRKK
jgi:hypothetical protein